MSTPSRFNPGPHDRDAGDGYDDVDWVNEDPFPDLFSEDGADQKAPSAASSDDDVSANDGDSTVSRLEMQEVVRELESAVGETGDLLALFHRSAVCKVPPDDDLIAEDTAERTRFGEWFRQRRGSGIYEQDAFITMAGAHARLISHEGILAARAWKTDKVLTEEYDALLEKVKIFQGEARRLSTAFRAALSDLDPLTGTHTRQSMEQDLAREQQRALRSGQPCCISLADIDFFKQVNDSYGRLVGDQVLAAITRILIDGLRPYDSIFRCGGEEFLLCLPDTGPEEARTVLERMRQKIEEEPMLLPQGGKFHVTCSFGIAQIALHRQIEEIIERADKSLYVAKESGRNRVRVWTAELM